MSLTCPLCGGNLEYVRHDNYKAIFICKGESCELGGHGMSAEAWLILAEQQKAWVKLQELGNIENKLDAIYRAGKEMYDYLSRDDASEKEFEVASAFQRAVMASFYADELYSGVYNIDLPAKGEK